MLHCRTTLVRSFCEVFDGFLLPLQGILDRLNAHKRDLEALSKAAQDMMEVDEDGCAVKEMQELIERFEALQKNISEKREYFQRVTDKWHKFAEQKHKMNSFFRNTHGIVTKRQVKSADDCKKQIQECEVTKTEINIILLRFPKHKFPTVFLT